MSWANQCLSQKTKLETRRRMKVHQKWGQNWKDKENKEKWGQRAVNHVKQMSNIKKDPPKFFTHHERKNVLLLLETYLNTIPPVSVREVRSQGQIPVNFIFNSYFFLIVSINVPVFFLFVLFVCVFFLFDFLFACFNQNSLRQRH